MNSNMILGGLVLFFLLSALSSAEVIDSVNFKGSDFGGKISIKVSNPLNETFSVQVHMECDKNFKERIPPV